ncbi:MAG: 2,3-bisphosphoglycerate-independent phosphoglycerate mutase [Magnetococcales bacterium]|nr:2,3-bisphosphoglycerate-independent phosphoglycerate mutase [Magnetococcales bacterium]
MRPKPIALVVLDGWGICAETQHNAIYHANTPHFDHWWQTRPHALIQTSAGDVGLPDGQMGNSEVGHTNLGAGRIVYQDLTRINRAIWNGGLADNPAIEATIDQTLAQGGAVHLCGLLSPGGVHSHSEHLLAAVLAAKNCQAKEIYIHAILDGRDTPPRSALDYLATFQQGLKRIGAGRIVSVCGRYYAMDRDQRWERVQRAYDMLTLGSGQTAADPLQAVQAGYARGEDDEFLQPTLLGPAGQAPTVLQDGDGLLMLNFRADRMREICHALLDPATGEGAFQGFVRTRQPRLAGLLTMTQYDTTLQPVAVAFPPEPLTHILGEILSQAGLRQLRAAETEKYAHVTYFFNGGRETAFPGEERLLVPSPRVATYDLQPAMSAEQLTQQIIEQVHHGQFDFMVANYANPDMVGHTGKMAATIQAVETVDRCLGQLVEAILHVGGEVLITADHGNADCMMETSTGQPHTAHTNNPAPLLYLGRPATLQDGRLCDIAPTILQLLHLPQPAPMTGTPLLRFPSETTEKK